MKVRTIAGLAGLALISGCSEPPGQVALSAHDAYERLAKGDLTEFIFKRQCGILIHAKMEAEPDRSVTWHILSSGRRMLSFTATLTPVKARRTKVDIAVSRDPDGGEAYDGTRFYRRPALQQPVRPALEELVAALLNERAFDAKRLPKRTTNDFNINSPCDIQRGGVESGNARFSIDDTDGPTAIRFNGKWVKP
jgi:hypothetical protein